MGLCASSTARAEPEPDTRLHGPDRSTISVVRTDGKVEEHKQPVKAGIILSQPRNRDLFLCSSECLSIDSCPPRIQDDEELQPDQIYFLLPLSRLDKLLTLADLCGLAIQARSVLGNVTRDHPRCMLR